MHGLMRIDFGRISFDIFMRLRDGTRNTVLSQVLVLLAGYKQQ